MSIFRKSFTDTTKLEHRQLKINDGYYSKLTQLIDIDKIYQLNDIYPHLAIESRGTPISAKVTIFYRNKNKTIKGELSDLPKEIQNICYKLDSLINYKFETWSTSNLQQCFFDVINIKSIIIYKIREGSMDNSGHWELKGKDLREFKNETKTFIRIDPTDLKEDSYKGDKYLIVKNAYLDQSEPYLNVIMTDGKYFKPDFYLWFKDDYYIIEKYLTDTNWCQQ